MGKAKKAEPLYNEARCVFEKAFGINSPATIEVLLHLCSIYEHTGRQDEAAELYKRLKGMVESSPKMGAAERLQILSGCTHEMYRNGSYEEAREVTENLVTFSKSKFGDDHKNTWVAKRNLAMIYQKLKRYEEARKLLMELPPNERGVGLKCMVM